MDSARPYYSSSWAPILYAATLWLNVKGFELNETTDSNAQITDRTNDNDDMKTDSNRERFHLLFGNITDLCTKFIKVLCFFIINVFFTGICMEALCSPRSSESTQNIETCLSALYTLLDSNWARKVLMVNRSLSVELCNVLHR